MCKIVIYITSVLRTSVCAGLNKNEIDLSTYRTTVFVSAFLSQTSHAYMLWGQFFLFFWWQAKLQVGTPWYINWKSLLKSLWHFLHINNYISRWLAFQYLLSSAHTVSTVNLLLILKLWNGSKLAHFLDIIGIIKQPLLQQNFKGKSFISQKIKLSKKVKWAKMFHLFLAALQICMYHIFSHVIH